MQHSDVQNSTFETFVQILPQSQSLTVRPNNQTNPEEFTSKSYLLSHNSFQYNAFSLLFHDNLEILRNNSDHENGKPIYRPIITSKISENLLLKRIQEDHQLKDRLANYTCQLTE